MKKNARGLKETIMRKNQTIRLTGGQGHQKKTRPKWRASSVT